MIDRLSNRTTTTLDLSMDLLSHKLDKKAGHHRMIMRALILTVNLNRSTNDKVLLHIAFVPTVA